MSGQGTDEKKLPSIKNDSTNDEPLATTPKLSKPMPRTYYSEQTSTPDPEPLEEEEISATPELETQEDLSSILNSQSSPIKMSKEQETPGTSQQLNDSELPRASTPNNTRPTTANNKKVSSPTPKRDDEIICVRRQNFPETSHCRPWTPCEEVCTSAYVPLTRCRIIEPPIIRKTPLTSIKECKEGFSQSNSQSQTPNGHTEPREHRGNNSRKQESSGWWNGWQGQENDPDKDKNRHCRKGRGSAGRDGSGRGDKDQGSSGLGFGNSGSGREGTDQSGADEGSTGHSGTGQGSGRRQGSASDPSVLPSQVEEKERGRTPPKTKSNESVFSLGLPPIIRKVFPYYPRGLIVPKCQDIVKDGAKRKKNKLNKGESAPWNDALKNFYKAIHDADERQKYTGQLGEAAEKDKNLIPESLSRESGTLPNKKQTAAEEVEAMIQGKMAQVTDLFDAELKGLTETFQQLNEERDPVVEESLQAAWVARKRDLQQQIEEFLNNALNNIIAAQEQEQGRR